MRRGAGTFVVEFHTQIAACSKNRVVKQLLPIINSSVMTFATITHRMLKEETLETHRVITEAIKKRMQWGQNVQ